MHTEIEAGVLTVAIVGEVDLAGARTLGDALTEAVDALGPPTSVLLDLRATTYLASAGVALLAEVAARARRRGHRVDARSEPGSAVGRVLALSGLDGVLTERPV